ncbi:unnamed protein product [Cylicocyclus nassatus]|uniref:V-type proton ATPase subunit S1/VOA1 transmembrane domain-containing protein n=1 Tax=Cylicocyclus nassatus TaxID=53992 RepID=A0AA36H5L2_CYLNA|nr:unnamed protein product [Cylicocyclus nassatus]
MRVLIAVLLIVTSATGYDAVVFSSIMEITNDYPSMENLLSTATPGLPLVFIANPDFTLGQFSRETRAYATDGALTGLPAIAKLNKYHVSRYLEDKVSVLNATKVTSADEFRKGNAIYLITGDEWTNMQLLAVEVLSELKGNYIAVITATEAVATEEERTKRAALYNTKDMTGSLSAGNELEFDMPLNLPPYNRTDLSNPEKSRFGSCMLYSEGVNIVVWKNVSGTTNKFASIPVRWFPNTTSWSYVDGDVKCDNFFNGTDEFTVRLKLKTDIIDRKKLVKINKGSSIVVKLIFTGNLRGWWNLTNVELSGVTVEDNGAHFISGPATVEGEVISNQSVYNVGFHSVIYHSMGCSNTQAAFFKTNLPNVLIGISLHNTEVQTFGVFPDKKSRMRFTAQVEDCVGTFSVGSWMIIITFLVVFGGVLFGYLMLNSIQTTDRFDDPKHGQIVINVKE